MNARSCSLTVSGLVALSVAPAALAGGVVRLAEPSAAYPTIQSALDASTDGDILLVTAGTYPTFTVDGKAVAIFAAPGPRPKVKDGAVVQGVGLGKTVVLAGLEFEGGVTRTTGLELVANAAHIRIDSCVCTGYAPSKTLYGLAGGVGVRAVNDFDLTVVRSTFTGGRGGDAHSTSVPGGDGGVGLEVSGSRVAAYDSTLQGGNGGIGGLGGAGQPGHGCDTTNVLAAVNTTLGFLQVSGGSGEAYLVDCTLTSSTVGSVTFLPGTARITSAPLVLHDGAPLSSLDWTGLAGDRLYFGGSSHANWELALGLGGVATLPRPVKLTHAPLGVVSASGSVSTPFQVLPVAAPSIGHVVFGQGFVLPAGGGAVLATPVTMLVLDRTGAPDCDGNEVLDLLDVFAGATDTNQNLVPDACEPPGPWYVAASAPPNGDGSSGAPFRLLGQAFLVARTNQTILVDDGIYTGEANRELVFGNRELTVQSLHGPAACSIDCESLGRAFYMNPSQFPTPKPQTLDGIRILRGRAFPMLSSGGAISIVGAGPATVRNCVFENCLGEPNGGAIDYNGGGSLVIESSTFRACMATNGGAVRFTLTGGVGGLTVRDSVFEGNGGPTNNFGSGLHSTHDAVVTNCSFTGNVSAFTGACAFGYYAGAIGVDHCVFTSNTALYGDGAGIYADPQLAANARIRVDDCLFAGNRSVTGGAASLTALGGGAVSITNSTFVGNSATSNLGGGLFVEATNGAVANSIFWNNPSPNDAQLACWVGTTTISYCDLQFGQAGVVLGGGAALDWGLGNFDLDPQFVDPDGDDNDPNTFVDNVYRLLANSPCLDAGDNSALAPDIGDIDLDGDMGEPVPLDVKAKTRRRDLPAAPDVGHGVPPLVDLGCYERQS